MQKFPFYSQEQSMDCGPACIRMIAKYYGKEISSDKLRVLSQLGRDGTSLLGLAEAAESIGFQATGVLVSFEELVSKVKLPAIIHFNQNHFVVVTPNSKSKYLDIADPGKGRYKITKSEINELWLSTINSENNEKLGVALVLELTEAFYHHPKVDGLTNNTLNWKRLFSYFLPHKKYLVNVFVASCVVSIIQLILPFLTQSVIDVGIGTSNIPFLYLILIGQIVLFISRLLVDFIRNRILLYISTRITSAILSDFWSKMMKLPISYFESKKVGDILQRISDHKRIESFLTGPAITVIFSVINLILFSVVLLDFSHQVFFIYSIGSIFYFLWITYFLKFRRKIDFKKFDLSSKDNSATMQLIYGMQEIKLNGAEQIKRWQWESIQANIFRLGFKSLTLNQFQQAGVFLFNDGKNVIISFVVALAVVKGDLTLGSLVAIQFILGQLSGPVEQLISLAQTGQDSLISMQRLNEIHGLENEERESSIFHPGIDNFEGISFSNVTFSYPGAGNETVLKNISFKIPKGQTVAIVGISGSGKTTILKLLLRYYENYTGAITVGDSSLKDLSPRLWRQCCGSVLQDGYFFNDTIAGNIAVGHEFPILSKLVYACKIANILDFIESLPLRFDTVIGAEGKGLSAGQKQRLLIARAIYRNPMYLFFDEATNSLDAKNESFIINNLQEFFIGRTVIVVAHRLSTVKNADKILVLSHGEIVEMGTHDELAKRKGEYYKLVENQLELGN